MHSASLIHAFFVSFGKVFRYIHGITKQVASSLFLMSIAVIPVQSFYSTVFSSPVSSFDIHVLTLSMIIIIRHQIYFISIYPVHSIHAYRYKENYFLIGQHRRYKEKQDISNCEEEAEP